LLNNNFAIRGEIMKKSEMIIVLLLLIVLGITFTGSTNIACAANLIQPADIQYVGAFRLPIGRERPYTFEYGGNAMTYNPSGDPTGPNDSFPGSLFITGHDRLGYGELPNGGQVAEVNIPVPVNSKNLSALNRAAYLQDFHDVMAGHFTAMEEIPRIGLLYLNAAATGPKIHVAYGQHFEPDPPAPTHGWFSPDLSHPNFKGEWYIGNQSFYSVNDYLFEIPTAWANANVGGRYIATGRFRDGGWSGMGPALYAYCPWNGSGNPMPSGTHLQEKVLLHYESSTETENIEHCLSHYQHPDEWSGGAWLTTSSGKSAVLFAGTKSNGTKYWYGFVNPASPDLPCVAGAFVDQFPVCRMANGARCPAGDLHECAGHNDDRGWWSTHFDAEFILYNPDDLAKVARGEIASWVPQPYATIDIDDHLYLNPAGIEREMLGTGNQRRFRLGSVAYDRNHGLIYVLELFADGAMPVVHVFRIKEIVYPVQIISLYPVYNAQCGHASSLWARVKNTGSSVLPSDAKAWFWVNGPSWSGNHWVGSAPVAGLVVNASKWVSYAWAISAAAKAGSYIYWARVFKGSSPISGWKGPQTFTVSCGGSSVSARVISLWQVVGARCGHTSNLWSQVRNTGGSTLPTNAKVWYWVNGPSWSGNHWVGSTSVAGLAANITKWYSCVWAIPSGAKAGSYVYWAQVWATKAISAWKGPRGFVVSCP
jgi:hypothetical protein